MTQIAINVLLNLVYLADLCGTWMGTVAKIDGEVWDIEVYYADDRTH